MSDIKERLDILRGNIQEEDFLLGKGLSNEVNIRMFCYDAKDEMIVQNFVEQLKTDQSLNCRLIEVNLYETFLSICDDKRITNSIPAMEEKKGKEFILKQMNSVAKVGAFIDKIQYEPHMVGEDILLITGVGDVFPFLRVHTLLDALQPYFSDIPILVMYPGKFDGSYMKLFNKLKPNPYYRAFNEIGTEETKL